MIKFDLSELTVRPQGTTLLLPAISERLGTQDQYKAILNRMLKGMASHVRNRVLPSLREFRRTNDSLFLDTDLETETLRAVSDGLAEEATVLAASVVLSEAQRHTETFIRTVNTSAGVDLSAVIRNEDLVDSLDDANRKGASLIKSLSDDNIKNVERIVLDAKVNGASISRVENQLRDQFVISRKRANLIATDQTQKLNGNLNKLRQEQIGVTHYIWRTSADERVRSLHRGLDGNRYKWGQPTGAEGGQEPSQPIRCRCQAIAVVEF